MTPDQHAQITGILDRTMDMTLATLRPDGFPQANVVAFMPDGFAIYFATERNSQKVRNIGRCDKVSLTVTPPYTEWNTIEGLSVGGFATVVTDPDEVARAGKMMMERFPAIADLDIEDTEPPIFIRVDPVVVSLLDYSKGFGHTELIEAQERLAPA